MYWELRATIAWDGIYVVAMMTDGNNYIDGCFNRIIKYLYWLWRSCWKFVKTEIESIFGGIHIVHIYDIIKRDNRSNNNNNKNMNRYCYLILFFLYFQSQSANFSDANEKFSKKKGINHQHVERWTLNISHGLLILTNIQIFDWKWWYRIDLNRVRTLYR